jgi:ribonucleoside-diphosphate reductase alpha chain
MINGALRRRIPNLGHAAPSEQAPSFTTPPIPGRYLVPARDIKNRMEPERMIANRRVLPATRESVTHKFAVDGHEGYLTVGLYADGTPGEIFIKISKEGSALSGMCQAFCRAFSLSIQHGLSLSEAVARFKGMRFEPMGMTRNPEIPHAESIVDYVARYLELSFAAPAARR